MVYTIGNSILAYNVPLGTLQVISETPRPEWQKCFGPHAWQQGFGTGSTVSGLVCYHCNNEEKGCSHILAFFMPTRQFRLSGDIMFLTGPFVRLFVRPSVCPSVCSYVTNLVNTVFRKRLSRFCCKLAQIIHGARRWNGQLFGSGGQSSRSHNAEAWRRHHYRPRQWNIFFN